MATDPSLAAELRAIRDDIRELKTAVPLQNASVTQGRLRFIGGLLLIDTGGTLEVIGFLKGDGTFEWSGNWKFVDGNGEIAGNVDLTGDFTLIGKLLAGDVTVEKDKITVAGGASPVTLEQGSLEFETGGKLEADVTNAGVRLIVGTNRVYVGTNAVAMQVGSRAFVLTPSGFTFQGLDTIPKSQTLDNNPIGSMYFDPGGTPYRVIAG